MKKNSKITKIVYYVFIGVVGITALLMLISTLPITGNYRLMVVQSGSMEPKIGTGSVVVVKPEDSYRIGDIITFDKVYNAEAPISHRIVEKEIISGKYFFTTKGDANESNDPKKVPKDNVVGKVLFHIPFIGYVINAAREPIGFIILIAVPGGIIIYDEVIKIKKEMASLKSKK